MVLVLLAVCLAIGAGAFASNAPRAVRIAAFALSAAGIAFVLFAVLIDRMN